MDVYSGFDCGIIGVQMINNYIYICKNSSYLDINDFKPAGLLNPHKKLNKGGI